MKELRHKSGAPVDPASLLPVLPFRMDRRLFMRWAGMTTATGVLLSSCSRETVDELKPNGARSAASGIGADVDVDLGMGDIAVLNYAYALEQIEATYYERVVANPYGGISAMELSILKDIRDHEVAHREFFKKALGSAGIPELAIDFNGVNFGDRMSVLTTARTFEDVGVSAYNGAGKFLVDVKYLLTAGKIVSVEARHASVIRELIQPNSRAFAGDDVVDMNGLDVKREPTEVLPIAQSFIKQHITANHFPTA